MSNEPVANQEGGVSHIAPALQLPVLFLEEHDLLWGQAHGAVDLGLQLGQLFYVLPKEGLVR